MKVNSFSIVILTFVAFEAAALTASSRRQLQGNMGTSLNDSNSECLTVVGEPNCINVQLASFDLSQVSTSGGSSTSSIFPIFENNILFIVPGGSNENHQTGQLNTYGFGWGRRLSNTASNEERMQKVIDKMENAIKVLRNKMKADPSKKEKLESSCMDLIAQLKKRVNDTEDPFEKFRESLKLKIVFDLCKPLSQLGKRDQIKKNHPEVKNFFSDGSSLKIVLYKQFVSEKVFRRMKRNNDGKVPILSESTRNREVNMVTYIATSDNSQINRGRIRISEDN